MPIQTNANQSQYVCIWQFLFLAHSKGLSKYSMTQGVMNGVVLRNGSQACRKIHIVAPVAEESIAFTDVESRQRGGSIVVIAGTGEESNRSGSGSNAAFGQLMGLCTEGNSLFVINGHIGTVKVVTTIRGTVEILDNLGKFNRAFSVHFKHQSCERHTLQESHEMVKGISTYFKSTIDDVKTTINSSRVTNGPEGTISTKTATSLELVRSRKTRY